MRKSIKRAGFIAVSVVATSTVGVGFASWSASGVSGGAGGGAETPGSARAKQALQVATTAPGEMYPTQSAPGNVVATITNPNPYNVTLTSATITGVTSSKAGCTPSLSWFPHGAATFSNAVVRGTAHGGGTQTATFAITSVTNDVTNECESAPLAFQVTVAGASN